MREAFGGTMLMYILIPILFVFVFFMAFIMRYASTYRASNYIVSMIETCDADMSGCAHAGGMGNIADYIKKKYQYNVATDGMNLCYIENSRGTIYRVTLYVNFDVPLIGNLKWYSINTETRTIYNVFESKSHTFGGAVSCGAV